MTFTRYMLVAVVALAGGAAYISLAPAHGDEVSAPIFDGEIPAGYRDWRLIAVAHEEGNLALHRNLWVCEAADLNAWSFLQVAS
jgi:hypothetical protein